MRFIIHHTDNCSNARSGELETAHGKIQTPVFMPVGTAANVKAVHVRDLYDDVNARIILGNTYHLYLRPGTDVIQGAGGLHKFIGWNRPILTDSGGFQVFSLQTLRKMNEEGVTFQSHIDGSKHIFSPENVIDIQRAIGADIMMAFDECTPYPCEYDYARNSMDITHRWLKRCVERFSETDPLYGYEQSLFPIVQGSTYTDLRKRSAEVVSSFEADGNAIGGLSVGEPHEVMYEITSLVCDILPIDKPRYLMGVGTPANILESIALGVDMFDCVMPTRNARNGMIFTRNGFMNMRNNKWKDDYSVLDEEGTSFVDRQYSRAYVRHLFKAGELLGGMIASLHNLAFYMWLVDESKRQIEAGTFSQWKDMMIPKVTNRL